MYVQNQIKALRKGAWMYEYKTWDADRSCGEALPWSCVESWDTKDEGAFVSAMPFFIPDDIFLFFLGIDPFH